MKISLTDSLHKALQAEAPFLKKKIALMQQLLQNPDLPRLIQEIRQDKPIRKLAPFWLMGLWVTTFLVSSVAATSLSLIALVLPRILSPSLLGSTFFVSTLSVIPLFYDTIEANNSDKQEDIVSYITRCVITAFSFSFMGLGIGTAYRVVPLRISGAIWIVSGIVAAGIAAEAGKKNGI